MLNELYSLSAALKNKGISTREWHREYKPLPKVTAKAPCIRIWLARDGSVRGIESISAELAQLLRKYGNNQGTFPAFNIVPLYRITEKEQLSELEQIEKGSIPPDLDKIKSWCVNDNWKESIVKKVDRSLHNISQTLSDLIGNQEQPERTLVSELIRLADGFTNEPNRSFKSALEKCVFAKLQKQEDIGILLAMLFHKGNPQKNHNADTGVSISVVLDLFEWQQYGYPVTSQHATEWINDRLLESSLLTISKQSEVVGIDAFGLPFVNPNEPMPSVKLNGFDVILRSMFSGQPCQYRYEQIDDASYPIALENRSFAKKSLEWVAGLEREGITWRKIDKNEIIFVYPSKLSETSPRFASIFGTSQAESSAQSEARFENNAKDFIRTLKGLPTKEKSDFIQIFTIRKLDKARSKVIFTRNCSPDQLIQAAEEWMAGCRNAPETDLGERKSPFPLQVAKIVNNVWKQNGELAQGKTAVERMKYYQGMELLLDLMQESMIGNYLHIVLTHSSGLVSYVGNWVHGGSKCKDKTEERALDKLKNETVFLLSVLGLLLYKRGARKENYMESMAYLVGQLLKISDELHTLYCNVVRGDVPPQLVGSALFATAGETPYQAMAQLSLRMNPYITWAKQYRFKDKTKNEGTRIAGWLLRLYEDVANKLYPAMGDVTRFNDFDKAQLFIGYLASFPKRESSVTASADDNVNDNSIGGVKHEH
ncbi:hypothetical protein DEAC_c31690 [Desulfosporosinus acididurans]|uniref:CRISPR-associated protein n=1 Tax=Desulfosporosinus acididurans TaxID=476652 RepID=A0A0J1IJD5_9FIRM|nr:hypothetical protein [Desulfosporosinus acididurans]KLU64841.1 hypothetical protein DEAC_c31690 [Desulfosporosinus acididurans]